MFPAIANGVREVSPPRWNPTLQDSGRVSVSQSTDYNSAELGNGDSQRFTTEVRIQVATRRGRPGRQAGIDNSVCTTVDSDAIRIRECFQSCRVENSRPHFESSSARREPECGVAGLVWSVSGLGSTVTQVGRKAGEMTRMRDVAQSRRASESNVRLVTHQFRDLSRDLLVLVPARK